MNITQSDQCILISTSIVCFIMPGFYLFINKYYLYAICNLSSGIASICYWYNPVSTISYTIDIIVSRISTTIYFATTLYSSSCISIEHIISTMLLIILVIFLFAKSRNAFANQNNVWIIYHVGFHISCFLSIMFSYLSCFLIYYATTTLSPYPTSNDHN